jgi:hypothetical protein
MEDSWRFSTKTKKFVSCARNRLSLSANWERLVFSPANCPSPTYADGSTDWTQVTIVCIEYIGDYHDL